MITFGKRTRKMVMPMQVQAVKITTADFVPGTQHCRAWASRLSHSSPSSSLSRPSWSSSSCCLTEPWAHTATSLLSWQQRRLLLLVKHYCLVFLLRLTNCKQLTVLLCFRLPILVLLNIPVFSKQASGLQGVQSWSFSSFLSSRTKLQGFRLPI